MAENKNKNKVKFGLNNVHYAVINDEGTFETPKRIKGGVSISLEAAGEVSEFFADDGLYYGDAANQGYSGNLELALVTDEFKKDIFGMEEDNKGVVFESKDARQKNFALMFEINGDKNKTRYLYYNVSASRPGMASNTVTNSKEIKTETLAIKATADAKTGYIMARAATGDQAYEGWYTAVYTKSV